MTRRCDNVRIFKYELDVRDEVSILMPRGAEILCVQVQYGLPRLWAKVDTSQPKVVRHFAIYGTGHLMSAGHQTYIDTFQLDGGDLVFHVFEQIGVRPE